MRFTQEQFDEFALISGDDNPIHVDPEFSSRTRFGRTVAHGMMLFAFMAAEIGRQRGSTLRMTAQELRFPAPTFAGDEISISSTERSGAFDTVLTSSGTITAEGTTWITDPPSPAPGANFGASSYKRFEPGMEASSEHVYTDGDNSRLDRLTGVSSPTYPDSEVAPPLLGGLISALLGVTLPGPGTNWLRQRYRFIAPVRPGDGVVATVRITRLRPEKDLVDLVTQCRVDDRLVVDGEALVLARDVD